ncbi:hypothetical protein WA026_017262 [Henosepilachna vigintioctopunctata]|uniref:Uncharacterized protein n=1 Tax=Henosepilachna vigintioctopunctata TaxID=420089 RepID=A0AAW1UGW2_9CUCU
MSHTNSSLPHYWVRYTYIEHKDKNIYFFKIQEPGATSVNMYVNLSLKKKVFPPETNEEERTTPRQALNHLVGEKLKISSPA